MHAGFVAATGALITPIELTSDRKVSLGVRNLREICFGKRRSKSKLIFTQAYFVGKPSAIIMNHALKKFNDLQRSDVVIIGDNMDTDILSLSPSSSPSPPPPPSTFPFLFILLPLPSLFFCILILSYF